VTVAAAGKHTLLEKPLAIDVETCHRILAAAAAAGVVFAVAENAQFIPDVVKAKELIEQGTIGDVYFAHANLWESTIDSDFAGGFAQGWRNDPAQSGGGNTLDGGTHWVRALRVWMGEIESVVAVNEHPLASMAGESLTQAIVRFSSGKSASFHCLVMDAPLSKQPFFRIQGSKGELVLEGSFEGGLRLVTAESGPDGTPVESDPSGRGRRGFLHSCVAHS
jgi:predicted dehydrogenase